MCLSARFPPTVMPSTTETTLSWSLPRNTLTASQPPSPPSVTSVLWHSILLKKIGFKTNSSYGLKASISWSHPSHQSHGQLTRRVTFTRVRAAPPEGENRYTKSGIWSQTASLQIPVPPPTCRRLSLSVPQVPRLQEGK